jgi:hypothetical protein
MERMENLVSTAQPLLAPLRTPSPPSLARLEAAAASAGTLDEAPLAELYTLVAAAQDALAELA